MNLTGTLVKRTRVVRTDQFVVVVEVDAIIPEADASEACYMPETVRWLREVELRARAGDVDWLRQRGRVYQLVEAA